MLAKEKYGIRARDMKELAATFVPFTAQTRMSGIDAGSSSVRKGAVDAILNYIGGGTAQSMASGNAVRALQPAVNSDAAPRDSRPLPMKSPRMAVRRSQSRRTAACSASFTSRTSSRAASASALPNCAAWASAP